MALTFLFNILLVNNLGWINMIFETIIFKYKFNYIFKNYVFSDYTKIKLKR